MDINLSATHRKCPGISSYRMFQPNHPRRAGRMKAFVATVAGSLLASCTTSTGPAAPDMGPVGDGL